MNSAELVYTDFGGDFGFLNYYRIGSSANPAFETAYVTTPPAGGPFVTADATFPTAFGTAVPEPTSLMLIVAAGLSNLIIAGRCLRRSPAIREAQHAPRRPYHIPWPNFKLFSAQARMRFFVAFISKNNLLLALLLVFGHQVC
jgi:hypothetical protein